MWSNEGLEAIIKAGPFSFTYDGSPGWTRDKLDRTGDLRVRHEVTAWPDFPAVDWVLRFENAGAQDTAIIEEAKVLDLTLKAPLPGRIPYRLHRTNGAPSNPTDFASSVAPIGHRGSCEMGGGGGRSSNKDFPFFKIETGAGSFIIAIGWSGQWRCRVESPDNKTLRVTAGLEACHFRLHPGEKVRTPRILVMHWPDNSPEANAQFRRLIHEHYAARRSGQVPLPLPFCNTAFTRGGLWLNECNAENQISLIKAYAKLGLEALITDAGWFKGGWPKGAGNWDADPEKYPQGMAPVAAAARDHGMVYGLWFEPERVVAGTQIHRDHPEWCLPAGPEPQPRYLLDFGRPEVQEYFFNIVKGYMDLPGFKFYRQDFNMDPLVHWRFNEAPDRQGVVEMKYIEGLYAFWDRIAQAWPDSIREECASGGRRIDLETVARMHLHQDSDFWFENDTDQSQIWGVSQYLPNGVLVSHLNRLDDYSFHSTLASSLCLGWIADAPDFDAARGKELLSQYLAVRHLLNGAWYPLLPDCRDASGWMAMQFHRADLDEGLLLVFRRAESPFTRAEFTLHGLKPETHYEIRWNRGGDGALRTGADLMKGFAVAMPEKGRSEMFLYSPASRTR